jgi:hypothetical protein
LQEELAKQDEQEKQDAQRKSASESTNTAAAAAPAKGKPDPKKDAKKADPKKGGAAVADDPNVPKDLKIDFDLTHVKPEDDFLILDRNFTHMKHPLPKTKPDPAQDKRTARANELAQHFVTIRGLPITATVQMKLNFVPEPIPEPVKEEVPVQPPVTASSKNKKK